MDTTVVTAMQVNRRALIAALGLLAPITNTNGSRPILANIRAFAAAGTLRLTATDWTTTLEIPLPIEGGYSGLFLLPARDVFKALKLWTAETITITVAEGQILIEQPGATMPFPIVDPGLFPAQEVPALLPRFTMDAPQLARALETSAPFCQTNETRKNLTGVHIVAHRQGVRFEATDGHRLSFRNTATPLASKRAIGRCILPAVSAAVWAKALKGQSGACSIAWEKEWAALTLGDMLLTVRLVDGTFPDVSGVVPRDLGAQVLVYPGVLNSAVKSIAALIHNTYKPLGCRLEPGRMILAGEPTDQGQAVQVRPAEYSGPTLQAGFNGAYVLDFLALSKGGPVNIGFNANPLGPTAWRFADDPELLCVLMPLQLEWATPDAPLPDPETVAEPAPASAEAQPAPAPGFGAKVRTAWAAFQGFASRYFGGSKPVPQRAKRAATAPKAPRATRSPMTPEQRSAAARKAVETRRQRMLAAH